MLKVNEIFTSVKGEGLYIGVPMTFVRLSGCNLHCLECDTPHQHGFELSEEQIFASVQSRRPQRVVITGGEPLMQDLTRLLELLCNDAYAVHLETNGCYEIPKGFSWTCCSPKVRNPNYDWRHTNGESTDTWKLPGLSVADEVKVSTYNWFDFIGKDGRPLWPTTREQLLYIQPWAHKQFINPEQVNIALDLVHKWPHWRYSTQLHKAIGVK